MKHDLALFFSLWLKSPLSIGAVAPSSEGLARAVAHATVSQIAHAPAGPVIELGGGTGRITRALLDAGIAPDRLHVIECDPYLYSVLRRRFPQVHVVRGDARHLRALCREEGIEPATAIVSGLPLLSLPRTVRTEIVEESFGALRDGGVFVQFTYAPVSPLPRRLMGLTGRPVRTIWLNVPPATVWCYRRAATSALGREVRSTAA